MIVVLWSVVVSLTSAVVYFNREWRKDRKAWQEDREAIRELQRNWESLHNGGGFAKFKARQDMIFEYVMNHMKKNDR